MKNTQIIALHGFLGLPSDWIDLFNGHILSDKLAIPNLFHQIPQNTMWEWAQQFCHQAAKTKGPKILMGYSLGGRLAMHALILAPQLWEKAIFISAHTGLSSPQEKIVRLANDHGWAKRFESEAWQPLMNEWNRREAFKYDTFHFARQAKDYNRSILADVLRKWSLGHQDNIGDKLANIDIPVLMMDGKSSGNNKFIPLKLRHPNSSRVLIENAGHRLPWEKPKVFLSEIEKFLKI